MKTFIINYIIVTKISLFVKVFLELVFERKNVLTDKRNFLFLPIKKRPKLIIVYFRKNARSKNQWSRCKRRVRQPAGEWPTARLERLFSYAGPVQNYLWFLEKSRFPPQEFELLKQISHLEEKRKSCRDQEELRSTDTEINDKTAELNILKERYLKIRGRKFFLAS